nr:ferritin-4, chloroplastic-like [Tanacetum cinerariifolium]
MPASYRPVHVNWKDLDKCNVCHMDEEYANKLFMQCNKCRMMLVVLAPNILEIEPKNLSCTLIVGGGPTGVELAGEIAVDYLNKKITLLHKGYGLQEFLGVKASNKTLDWQQSKHVEVKLEKTINLEDVADGTMELSLSLEKLTNEKLLHVHAIANKNNDVQLADFFESEFLGEQLEAIKKISEYVAHLRRVGKGHGVWHFDQMLLNEEAAI